MQCSVENMGRNVVCFEAIAQRTLLQLRAYRPTFYTTMCSQHLGEIQLTIHEIIDKGKDERAYGLSFHVGW